MSDDVFLIGATLAIFLFAGFAKGVVGLGLPALAVGLLSLVMAPAQAVAMIALPSIVTNVWQFAAGPPVLPLAKRLAPVLAASFLAALAGIATGFLARDDHGYALAATGAALALYGVIGLTPFKASVPPRAERWLGPLVGAATGFIASVTGVLSIPSVPYLEALGLRKNELVQSLGLSFTASSAALMIGLASYGVLRFSVAALSIVALAPAIAGMAAGQWVRGRMNQRAFQIAFFLGMIALGVHLIARTTL